MAKVFKICFQSSDVNMTNKRFQNSVFHIESFLCHSHLNMSFPYSECLFHRNNLNLDLYHPENLSIWGFEWITRNLFEIELKIVWSHFKGHETFMKLKIVFKRRFDQKDLRSFLFFITCIEF